MPLVAAAVCPHPPLLVPEVAGAAASELDDLRAACETAVRRLVAANPDTVVLLGAGPASGPIRPPATGSLQPWGVDLDVPLGPGQPDRGAVLPLSLTIGAWLLSHHATSPLSHHAASSLSHHAASSLNQHAGSPLGSARVTAVQVTADAGPAALAALAEDVATAGDRVALLVLGDGSACRGEKSPGYDDPRALAYDKRVATALAGADLDGLRDLDPGLSAQLKVAGWAPWQVLAGAARQAGGWRGELLYEAAPYGVAYFVASWERV
ncbi:class III extradiol dioxygenase subunit B-like domain-containing protein [Micromonospora profundi]|uniref:class III extradiol dioxygenase subunit B-like domain-containing protein n=1 Tax=Micromonospora profundi TaxID=1420889 RepID=UPI0036661545